MNCLGATAARKGVRHGRRKPALSEPGRGGTGRKKDTLIYNSAKKLQGVHLASRFLAAGWTCSCSTDKGVCEEVHFCTFFSKNAKGKYLPIGYRLNTYNEFSCCYFTGKEKDAETGYGYFGARYMDHELMTMWLSVDPLADKYPSISPYAFCAWNPIKLVDPDGRIIDSASVTQNIKNMIDPTHECYNAEFAAMYRCLDEDKSTTYRFEEWDSFHKNNKNQDISGSVSLSEDRALIIGYTWGLETELDGGISPERALCEETRHAKQFCDGEFGFFRTSAKQWMVCGRVDEEEAHAWAARVSGSTPRYDLSHYDLNRTAPSAEHAWINDYKEKRAEITPNYNANGLYSSEFWFFKQPKNK